MTQQLRGALAALSSGIALLSLLALWSCASQPPQPQSLVDRAYDAMGGQALAGINTIASKGSLKQWEPEQSDVPGGEMRFANEATFATTADRMKRSTRTDWEKNFAYPTPRT